MYFVSYELIDPAIREWASKRGLQVYSRYREEEVRLIDVVYGANGKCQIWVDPPDGGRVSVHVWDYKKRREDFEVGVAELADCLDVAYEAAKKWIGEVGDGGFLI